MCRNTSGCLPYLIIKGIMDSGKKKFDPRSIDEKAILDIVARKGTIRPDSPATSASPKARKYGQTSLNGITNWAPMTVNCLFAIHEPPPRALDVSIFEAMLISSLSSKSLV